MNFSYGMSTKFHTVVMEYGCFGVIGTDLFQIERPSSLSDESYRNIAAASF